MRYLLIAAALSLVTSIAHADVSKVTISGKPVLLYRAASVNPNCTSDGAVSVRLSTPPEHGRVTIRKTRVFPNFRPVNPRSDCNKRGVSGVEATYVSARGYTGSDRVELEVIFPSGRMLNPAIRLDVR